MNKTPESNRTHIAIYGKRNAGKSSLLNAIVGQEIAIVSDIKGTTTDPVKKKMELLPYGPVVFIDTAGLDDSGTLGELRIKKSMKILQRTEYALYVIDSTDADLERLEKFKKHFKTFNIPYLLVFNKIDLINEETLKKLKGDFPEAAFVSVDDLHGIIDLKQRLINSLEENKKEVPIVGDLLNYNDTVLMVVPIDSEAPKGRIILPQNQMIRDCLDHGIKSYVVRDTELEEALKDLGKVDLVITDSQAFKRVDQIVPENIMLTSFSILFARHKAGGLKHFLKGIEQFERLTPESKILISECCTHNFSHEDIGRVKIPNWLEQKLGFKALIDFEMGHDFPENISEYDLVIHCGACMVNPKTVTNRIKICEENDVAITNYGLFIAYITGILNRSIEVVINKENLLKNKSNIQ